MQTAKILAFLLLLGAPQIARAATCNPGQYPDANGECQFCTAGFYCPDGTQRKLCPPSPYSNSPALTWCYNNDLGQSGNDGCTKTTQCLVVNYPYTSAHGSGISHCFYDELNQEYNANKCDSQQIQRCDAGYYYDGTITYLDCIAVGAGYYSPADSMTRTKCPDGTSTHTTTASSAEECEPLCSAGATEFHADNLTFKLWKECASPALRIGIGDNVCCVNLAPGTTTNAVHVQYNDKTYHTVN